jgi:glycosyltransferase involved in cell wall biosynthesis
LAADERQKGYCGLLSYVRTLRYYMNLKGKRILLCEEALVDEHGHFQSWIRAIRQMHLDAGADVYIAGNRAVIPDVRDDLKVLPVYSENSWDQRISGKWPAWRRHLWALIHNWRVFFETKSALTTTGPVDVVVFTAVRIHHVIGIRILCLIGLGVHFKRIVFFLLTSQAEYNPDFTSYRFSAQSRLLALVLRSFRHLSRSGLVILAGDSHITCSEYQKLAGIRMALFPSPGASLSHENDARPNENIVFTMLGVSTWDKGIDVFQAAILQFLARNPRCSVSFVLQWSVPCIRPDGHVISASESLRHDSRVTFIERRLSNDEYDSYFSASDFIVLPYRKSTYYNRISGVAVEAALSGKPMIVTENTWLSWAINQFGAGFAVPEGDVECWSMAIEKCCMNWQELQQKGRRRIIEAREYNSSERYLGLLWGGL